MRVFGLAVFYSIFLPLALVPYRLSAAVGRGVGLLLYLIKKKRRLIAIESIRGAIQRGALHEGLNPKETVRESFINLGRSLIEVIKIYYGTGRKILDSVSIEGAENFKRAMAKGRGVLFVTGHCGNWELLALVVGMRLVKVNVLAKPLKNPYLNAVVEAMRTKFGNSVVHKKGAVRGILRALKGGEAVGVLIDEAVPPEEGILIDFLGRPAWTARMPALVARRTSAPVLPAFIKRTATGHTITVYPELELTGDEAEDTRRISSSIEGYVKGHPGSWWLWIQDRWRRAPY